MAHERVRPDPRCIRPACGRQPAKRSREFARDPCALFSPVRPDANGEVAYVWVGPWSRVRRYAGRALDCARSRQERLSVVDDCDGDCEERTVSNESKTLDMSNHKDTKAQRHQEGRDPRLFNAAFLVSLCLGVFVIHPGL